MNTFSEEKIIDSWGKNVSPWAAAVRDRKIESRTLVTDEAIVEAVLSHSPRSVLDIGCGEGWLLRALGERVTHRVGVDVVPALIELAKTAGGGEYFVASYEAIAAGALDEHFDMVVCNFSLLGKESVEALFRTLPTLLNPDGVCIVQTLHPVVAGGESYCDGWREGSWAGFGPEFVEPAPWYFRTLESWAELFSASGFRQLAVQEPVHPVTAQAASVIFTGRL